jgi:ATP-dependent exoDNAse (exonuclease V) alpha subunit
MSGLKPMSATDEKQVLAGLVERVTFHNEENGFCVLRVKARGQKDLITVLGHAASISAGEWVTASGTWQNDRTHGLQFRAQFLNATEPTSIEGMEKYLASGMIRGVGPVYAKRLIQAFGDKVFDVIQTAPGRLREVDGIGPRRAERIIAAWAEQKIVREIMIFLHSHGVGTSRAVRIYKTYGNDAVQLMSENPYRLAKDIRGIGFKTADAIASRLGIAKDAMIRVRAGISYALMEALNEGHCGLPVNELWALAENRSSPIPYARAFATVFWLPTRSSRFTSTGMSKATGRKKASATATGRKSRTGYTTPRTSTGHWCWMTARSWLPEGSLTFLKKAGTATRKRSCSASTRSMRRGCARPW